MTEPDFWIVRSNGGCEACDAIAGLHLKPPRRPHPHCRCAYTPYWATTPGASDGSQRCRYDKHLLLSLTTDGGGSQWNADEGQYDAIVVNVRFSVMCKEGSIVEGTYTHEGDVESDRFPYSNQEDLSAWGEAVLDAALARWEEEADALCPTCVDAGR